MGGKILAPILSLCFSHAFELGIFPSIFKIAKVVPIFESGNKQNSQQLSSYLTSPDLI